MSIDNDRLLHSFIYTDHLYDVSICFKVIIFNNTLCFVPPAIVALITSIKEQTAVQASIPPEYKYCSSILYGGT